MGLQCRSRVLKLLSAAYMGLLYLLFTLLAPSREACAQGDVAGGTNGVNNSKQFDLFGTKFDFARKIDVSGSMSYENLGTSKYCDTRGTETMNVTVFSKNSQLIDWSTFGLVQGVSQGGSSGNGLFKLLLNPGGGAGVEQMLEAAGSYQVTANLSSKRTVNVSPQFTIAHDFGTITTPQIIIPQFHIGRFPVGPFTIPPTPINVGVRNLTLELDAEVKVTVAAKGSMSQSLNATSIDNVGRIDFSTTTELSRSIQLTRFGFAGLRVAPKLEGTGKIDFGKSSYEVDSHPTFQSLQGSAKSNIDNFDLDIGGKIKADLTFTLVVEVSLGSIDIVDLPSWTYTAVGSNVILYQR